MKPGTIVLPLASIRCAPAGMVVDAAGPTAVIRPPDTTSVPRSIGARPVPSMILALVNAIVPFWADGGGGASVATARMAPTTAARTRIRVRNMEISFRRQVAGGRGQKAEGSRS